MRVPVIILILFFSNTLFLYSQTNIVIHTGSNDYSGDYGSTFFQLNNKFKMAFIGFENRFLSELSTGIGFEGFLSTYKIKEKEISIQLISPKVYLKYHFDNGYFLPKNFFFGPFIIAGIGYSFFNLNREKEFFKSINFNYGMGLKLKFFRSINFETQTLVEAYLGDHLDGRVSRFGSDFILINSIGLSFNFSENKKTAYGNYYFK